MGVAADVRDIIQDLVAPELREIGAKLEALGRLQGEKLEALSQSQGATKTELLEAIVRSEERVMLALKVALLSQQNELLSQQNEQLLKQVSGLRKAAQ